MRDRLSRTDDSLGMPSVQGSLPVNADMLMRTSDSRSLRQRRLPAQNQPRITPAIEATQAHRRPVAETGASSVAIPV